MRRVLAILFPLVLPSVLSAQISTWQLGGSGGLAWSASDSVRIFIDFDSAPGAIQPIYLTSAQTVFSHLDNWSPWKFPREIGYIDGQRPRAWKHGLGDSRTVHNATYLVDGDSTTYNPPSSDLRNFDWFTFDVAVPVPATRFGFFTPPRGFRSDGTPLADDAVPAFEVSVATEADPAWHGHNSYARIGPLIADVAENLSPTVQIDLPRQYVRFIRWRRNESVLDPTLVVQENSLSGQARPGTIGDFELYARGVPQRVLYLSKIIDLGAEVNFGRLFWSATSMRMADGTLVPAPKRLLGCASRCAPAVIKTPISTANLTTRAARLKSRASVTSSNSRSRKATATSPAIGLGSARPWPMTRTTGPSGRPPSPRLASRSTSTAAPISKSKSPSTARISTPLRA